jgi:hypothetical protein
MRPGLPMGLPELPWLMPLHPGKRCRWTTCCSHNRFTIALSFSATWFISSVYAERGYLPPVDAIVLMLIFCVCFSQEELLPRFTPSSPSLKRTLLSLYTPHESLATFVLLYPLAEHFMSMNSLCRPSCFSCDFPPNLTLLKRYFLRYLLLFPVEVSQ